MYVPFRKWSPNAEPTEEGVLYDVENIIPSYRGFRSSPRPVKAETTSLASYCYGFSSETALSGTKTVFAGTNSKLYRKDGIAWTDSTRASGNYSLAAEARWCFFTQGNISFASSKNNRPQKFIHGTDTVFSDVTAMPMCTVAEALGRHILIGNVSSIPDQWACSAIDDYTNWTASVDDQCVFGRLVDTQGAITAIKRLSDYVVYYKSSSLYLCRYVGVPDVFTFSLISDNVGAVSQEAVVRLGRTHYFCGETNFYSFDSATLAPIGNEIITWFNANCNNSYRHTIVATKDESREVIYWFYPSTNATAPDSFVAYHYTSGRWGKGTQSVQAANEYFTTSVTYANIAATYTTYASFTNETYEELVFSENSFVPAVITTDRKLKLLTGSSLYSTITTNDFGIDGQITTVTRIRPRFINFTIPDYGDTDYSGGILTSYYRNQMGTAKTTNTSTFMYNGKFDVIQSARWHSGFIEILFTHEIAGLDIEAKFGGKE